MKRGLLFLLGLACLIGGGFFGIVPAAVDRDMNRIAPVADGPLRISDHARRLHSTLTIIDLHADTLLWRRDLVRGTPHGHVDLPRLDRGHVALQLFSSVTKTPRGLNYTRNSGNSDSLTALVIAQGQPVRTWHSLLERALQHANRLLAAEQASGGRLRIIRTREDLAALMQDRAAGRLVTGAMLSVEGAQALEGHLSNVDVLFDKGFRMFGLAHFFDNEVAGSVAGVQKYGLTPLGRQVIARMEQRGIMVDLAHSSHQTINDVLNIATRPVFYSHGGVKAVCNNNRNLTDSEIRGIAGTGGLIGIGYWDAAVCMPSPRAAARALTHVKQLVGVEHAALGSDFDGAVTEPIDTSQLVQVTQALIDAGWSDADIRAAMGGNALRVMLGLLPARRTVVLVP